MRCSRGPLRLAKRNPEPIARGVASDHTPIVLPKPRLSHGRTLASSLRLRRTTREISDEALSSQTLSNVLWAAFGVNRNNAPFGLTGRTAASASNSQEIEIYVVMAGGTYLYEPYSHRLILVVEGDLRPLAIGRGQSSSGHKAPVRLVYVADVARLAHTSGYQEPGLHDPDVQRAYYYVDTGLIAANVYLFAASVGLAAWFHNCDRSALSEHLGLRPDQHVLFGQTVGYALLPAAEPAQELEIIQCSELDTTG